MSHLAASHSNAGQQRWHTLCLGTLTSLAEHYYQLGILSLALRTPLVLKLTHCPAVTGTAKHN